MEKTLSVEALQKENQELRNLLKERDNLLRDRSIIAHALARKLSHIAGNVPEHRGDFDNCPSPECVEVRTALGKAAGNVL